MKEKNRWSFLDSQCNIKYNGLPLCHTTNITAKICIQMIHDIIICTIAIAYSMGLIINQFACVSVSISAHSHSRIS